MATSISIRLDIGSGWLAVLDSRCFHSELTNLCGAAVGEVIRSQLHSINLVERSIICCPEESPDTLATQPHFFFENL